MRNCGIKIVYEPLLCLNFLSLFYQRAVDLLLMKFTSAIHDKAYSVVAQYARGTSDSIDTKIQYVNLCKVGIV